MGRDEGAAFELAPSTPEYVISIGLADEQIEFVVGLAWCLACRLADDDRGRGDARSA